MTTLEYHGLNHASILVSNLSLSLNFYCDTLGMQLNSSRPNFNFKGAWLTIGNQEIHLLELPNPDAGNLRPAHVGRDRHTAISINSIDDALRLLSEANISYTKSQSGRAALFFRDPDDNGIEFVQVA
ncbi:hypothetical protein MNBD_GAMMA12-171 [hydrothermal vent metagenome]|uniref:VOC domain-containing protein n=1 Tax=hydrothermal vent metagenome TaxID=652676 RepID=A0A3B0YGH3_9ZZZZ